MPQNLFAKIPFDSKNPFVAQELLACIVDLEVLSESLRDNDSLPNIPGRLREISEFLRFIYDGIGGDQEDA